MGSTLHSFLESYRPPSLQSWSCENEDLDSHWRFEFAHIRVSLTLSHRLSNNTYHVANLDVRDIHGPVRRRDLDPIRRDVRALFNSPSAPVPSSSSHHLRTTDMSVAVLQGLERVAAFESRVAAEEEDARRRAHGWDATQISSWDEVLANPRGLDASTVADTAHDLLGQTPAELVAGISDEFRVVHVESVVRGDLLARFLHYQRALGETLQRAGSAGQNLRRCMPPGGGGGCDRRLPSRLEDVVADMIRPRVTFHGTPLRSVRSIVRHGFVKPGRVVDGRVVASPRTGIAYDRGIYSSPCPGYALSYAVGGGSNNQRVATPLGMLPSLRLVVCATVMGRTLGPRQQRDGDGDDDYDRAPDARVHGPLADGFDAHWDGGLEYITHHEAAMLPCYVIHLDLGSAAARAAVALARADPTAYQRQVRAARRERRQLLLAGQGDGGAAAAGAAGAAPGDQKRAAEARKAAAMKWFPYGYGTARGTRFVVEEVGEVSDDEEDYGEWQEDRHAYLSMEKEGHWLDSDEHAHTGALFAEVDDDDAGGKKGPLFLDGYQTARY
ncbi:poly(ADP-ribose) polymerase catalytic domain-containing protein [Cordyceps javanica]|nr:poly(ADP-ribose) polymerase catalytic domain-containing protein [Cordyceps javanica]